MTDYEIGYYDGFDKGHKAGVKDGAIDFEYLLKQRLSDLVTAENEKLLKLVIAHAADIRDEICSRNS